MGDTPSIGFTIRRLSNLLRRRENTSQDARRKRLIPTEKALAIHAELVKKKVALESLIRSGISDEELETFLYVAKKIEQNLA